MLLYTIVIIGGACNGIKLLAMNFFLSSLHFNIDDKYFPHFYNDNKGKDNKAPLLVMLLKAIIIRRDKKIKLIEAGGRGSEEPLPNIIPK